MFARGAFHRERRSPSGWGGSHGARRPADGSGLSASAALEVAAGLALCRVSDVTIDLTDLALYCQRAENEFVGMRCGVMDQFISCRAVAGCALLLDCRSLEARRLRIDPARLVICNTMVHHELRAARIMRGARRASARSRCCLDRSTAPGVARCDARQLKHFAALLPDPILRRARHILVKTRACCRRRRRSRRRSRRIRLADERVASQPSRRLPSELPELDLMSNWRVARRRLWRAHDRSGFGGCTVNW